jgi:hypothetical protein
MTVTFLALHTTPPSTGLLLAPAGTPGRGGVLAVARGAASS